MARVQQARQSISDSSTPGSRVTHAGRDPLPVPLTPLIGREREVAIVVAKLVDEGVRLLTLTGPGGVGKTRLALRAAEEARTTFLDGVRFVPLASVTDPTLVVPHIAHALDLRWQGNREPLELLEIELRSRHLLLVLDNFEQILASAPVIGDLLAACPRLSVLITSRAKLHVYGEHDFPVLPLALPIGDHAESVSDLESVESVRLFVARARAADPAFTVTTANAADIAGICRALDGLPLAIELAAARVNLFPPRALFVRLERRLPLLIGGVADVPARLRTMRDAVAWSYDLLTDRDQRVFRRLAVFAGGFIISAATEVAGTNDSDTDVVGVIATLVEHSLLVRVAETGEEPRFGMLEVIREFALEQLEAAEEEHAAHAAHAAYFLAQAEEANAVFWGRRSGEWQKRLESELANARIALSWLIGRNDGDRALRLVTALEPVWWIFCHQTEGQRRLHEALALRSGVSNAVVVAALVVAGRVATAQGDYPEALARGREALELAQMAELPPADALYLLGNVFRNAPDLTLPHDAVALTYFEEALAAYHADEEPVRRAWTLLQIAGLSLLDSFVDLALVRAHYEEALTLCRNVGHTPGTASASSGLGDVARRTGDLSTAIVHYRASLVMYAELGHLWGIARVFESLAMVAAEAGAAERGTMLFGTASLIRDELELPISGAERPAYDAALTGLRRVLGPRRFDALWIEARRRDLSKTTEDAAAWLASLEESPAFATPETTGAAEKLSPREREVLHHVAAGMSDREIAATLSISYRTVTNHVASILAKLDAPTRTAAAALAVRRGLV